ncbi:putative transcriptional regulator TetR family protein [Streptomyces badius]
MPTKKKPQVTPTRERRRELLATAAEVFAAQGYNATTVRRIADEAGMLLAQPLLPLRFQGIDDRRDPLHLPRRALAGLRRGPAAGLGPRETIEALVTEFFREIDRHRPAVAIYQKESKDTLPPSRASPISPTRRPRSRRPGSTLERGVTEGVFRDDLYIRLTYRFVRDTVWVAASWYWPGGHHGPEEIARQYLSMVLDGIALRT